jgi:hypothetical protein
MRKKEQGGKSSYTFFHLSDDFFEKNELSSIWRFFRLDNKERFYGPIVNALFHNGYFTVTHKGDEYCTPQGLIDSENLLQFAKNSDAELLAMNEVTKKVLSLIREKAAEVKRDRIGSEDRKERLTQLATVLQRTLEKANKPVGQIINKDD